MDKFMKANSKMASLMAGVVDFHQVANTILDAGKTANSMDLDRVLKPTASKSNKAGTKNQSFKMINWVFLL